MHGVGAAEGLGARLGQPHVAHVAGLHHLGDRSHRLLDPDGGIDPAEPVHVDVIGAQPPQRVGERALDRRRATVDADDLPVRRPQQPELHADRDRIPVTAG
jgi:hypothetical protein